MNALMYDFFMGKCDKIFTTPIEIGHTILYLIGLYFIGLKCNIATASQLRNEKYEK